MPESFGDMLSDADGIELVLALLSSSSEPHAAVRVTRAAAATTALNIRVERFMSISLIYCFRYSGHCASAFR
jgi:hypothetical protein